MEWLITQLNSSVLSPHSSFCTPAITPAAINRETGQTGTAYARKDLGRVRLSVRPLVGPAEIFTIKSDTEAGTNLLRLQWDDAERVAPFRVRAK